MTLCFKTLPALALVALTAGLGAIAADKKPSNKPAKNVKPPPPPAVPRHDPADMPFRCVPMANALRSIHIPVGGNLHVAFDSELLRTHVAWQGETLNLWGAVYHERKDRFYCDFKGETLWTMPPVFPWSVGEKPGTPLTSLPKGTRFLGVDTVRGETVLRYEVSADTGKVLVRETPRADAMGNLEREFSIAPRSQTVWFLALAEPANGRAFETDASVVVTKGDLNATQSVWKEAKNDSELKREPVRGAFQFVWVKFPPSDKPLNRVVSTKLVNGKLTVSSREGASGDRPAKAPAAPPVFAGEKGFPLPAGDAYYRVERFPVPAEIELQVTGLDFLPNGDAIACTWLGDVYVIEKATGSPMTAKYRRFARGLCEPGGVRVIDGEVYVAQKHELTRLRDTDGNGEADQFECVNNRWGFTGNYHDFTFGPTIDGAGNWHIFRNGNRGLYEVPLMGWDIIVSADGETVTPFCSGLRSPNGFGAFRGDVFMTENQGNWMGACKLNHFQKGRFYGYPSTSPAPKAEQFDNPKTFTPPAVWFPYKLARSASGVAVIEDDRFGPFKGQMLVGEFQNALVTRVFLEKVNGEWQGCVWPLAKGFNSGVNRLAFGPDGKLYVGGVKNAAWSAVVPKNWSLDRVVFTGKVPFDVKEVRARSDGFELEFTQALDAAVATKADNYDVSQYRYQYHQKYGSPEYDFDGKPDSSSGVKVVSATLAADGKTVRLKLDGWRAGYVAAIRLLDVTNADGQPVVHDTFHYTLNQIPKP